MNELRQGVGIQWVRATTLRENKTVDIKGGTVGRREKEVDTKGSQ